MTIVHTIVIIVTTVGTAIMKLVISLLLLLLLLIFLNPCRAFGTVVTHPTAAGEASFFGLGQCVPQSGKI